MMAEPVDVIAIRINAANVTQRRVSIALALCTAAAAVVLSAIWNLYLSWDSRWIDETLPDGATRDLQVEQIRQWVVNNVIDIPALGIHLSSSDAAFPGSLGLMVLAFYLCVCARRENHEVAALLRDYRGAPLATQQAIFASIRALMTSTDFDGPEVYFNISPEVPVSKPVWLIGRAYGILAFAPAAAIALIVGSDLYYTTIYAPPFNPGGAWQSMDWPDRIQLAMMIGAAVAAGIFATRYCWLATEFRRGTHDLMREFQARLATMS